MHVVILSNDSGPGFTLRALEMIQSMPNIARVDGLGLRANGRFTQIAVHLRSAELATLFTRLAQEQLGAEATIQG